MTTDTGHAFVWAAWSDDGLSIWQVSGDDRVLLGHLGDVPADRRYTARFVALDDGGALVLAADGAGTQVWQIGRAGAADDHMERVDLAATVADLPPWRVVPLRDGRVVGLAAGGLEVWQRETGVARVDRVAVPDGFGVRDLDMDGDGVLWICGCLRRGERERPRRAFASQRPGGGWDVRHGTGGALRDAWRAAIAGATRDYRRILTVGAWLVLCAEGGDDDDTSAFVFVRDPKGRWSTGVLSHDTFRSAAMVGPHLMAFSHRANALVFGQGRPGRRARRGAVANLREAMAAAGMPVDAEARIEVLGVAAGSPVLLHAGLRLGAERGGEAAVICDASGAGPVVAVQPPSAPEIVALCPAAPVAR